MDPSLALKQKMEDLLERNGRIAAHLRHQGGPLPEDWEERVSLIQDDEVLEGLDRSTHAEIQAIQQALQRLKAGNYGTCLQCGEKIAPRRLEAMPETALCLSCAAG